MSENARARAAITTVAWIGLGRMGLPMAKNLMRSGVRVLGVDVSPAACKRASEEDLEIVDSLSAAVNEADAVVTILPAAEHVRAVYGGSGGIWANTPTQALLVDVSTVDMETSHWCHEESANRGFQFVDAPVSGAVAGAAAGTLTAMVGGEEDAVERAAMLFAPMAARIMRAGGPATGIAAKICNNLMLYIHMMAASEGSQLAERLGLELKVFREIILSSSGRSFPMEVWFPMPDVIDAGVPADRNFDPDWPAYGALKDINLALTAGRDAGLNLAASSLVAGQFQSLIDEGLGDRDCTLIVKHTSKNGDARGFSRKPK